MILNFKSLLSAVVLTVFLMGCSDSATSNANAPVEGKQFTTIPVEMPDAENVVEVFSLACGHCRQMEAALPELESMIGLPIAKEHVTFNESAQRGAYLFYTAVVQGKGEVSTEQLRGMFSFVQDRTEEEPVEVTKQKLLALYHDYDMLSPTEVDDTQNEAIYKKMVAAETFMNNINLSSVPAFVVKGKYLVNTTEHENLEDIAATIKYLSEQN